MTTILTTWTKTIRTIIIKRCHYGCTYGGSGEYMIVQNISAEQYNRYNYGDYKKKRDSLRRKFHV